MSKRRTLVRTAAVVAFAVTVFVGERYALPRVGLAEGPVMPVGRVIHLSASARADGLIGASLTLAAGEMTPLAPGTVDKLFPNAGAADASRKTARVASDPLRPLPDVPCLEGRCQRPEAAASVLETTGSVIATAAPEIAAPVRQNRVFAAIDVVDGRSFRANGATIQLANVALPVARQSCRRIDGVIEPCAERAQTRLDLVTRHRPVTCDLEPGTIGGTLTGDCRVGGDDLALRLIREGWATPIADTPEAAVALAEARRLKLGIWQSARADAAL